VTKRKILFIPALFYLSNKLFFPIVPYLKGVESIYLDCDYALNNKYCKDYTQEIELIKISFDRTEIIHTSTEYDSASDKNILSSFRHYRKKRVYNRKTLKSIKSINPDLIVLTSDKTDVFKLITNYFNRIPLLVIQQAGIANTLRPRPNLRMRIRHHLLKNLFHYPTLPNLKTTNGNNLHFAYWAKFWNESPKNTINSYYTGYGAQDADILKGNSKLYKSFQLNQTLKVLYTTQPIGLNHSSVKSEYIPKMVLDYVIDNPAVNLTVKVHPRENEEFYKEFFSHDGIGIENVQVVKDVLLDNLIEESDIILTAWSMTSYQAIALGVPVISLNPDNLFEYSKFFPGKCIPQVSNNEELHEAIQYFSSQGGHTNFIQERKDFLKVINTHDDGQCSKRIADLIINLANGNV